MRGSDLDRPFHGIRVAAGTDETIALCTALALRLPERAFFCGVTAARIFGVPLPRALDRDPAVHVGVPRGVRAPAGRGVTGHTFAIAESELQQWAGIRVTEPARLWCDLATTLRVPDLVAAGDYLIHWQMPFTTGESLRAAVAHHPGRRGRPARVEALPLLHDRSESPMESHLRVVLLQAGLQGISVNHRIVTSGGFSYRGDLAFPEKRVIVEYQSRFHDTPERFRADMTRISRLEADEWFVIQVNADDLQNPTELVTRISRVLGRR